MPAMPMLPASLRRLGAYASAAALSVTFGATDSFAQESKTVPLDSRSHGTNMITTIPPPVAPFVDVFSMTERPIDVPAHSPKRPGALVPLYISFASLQALDLASTHRALDRGAREANPIVSPLIDSPGAALAIKAGAMVGVVFFTERLRKHHPVAAVLLMVGLNAGYVAVVAHNYSVNNR